MANFRNKRVADLLLSFLAEEVRGLNDPRLHLLTLTAVEVSPDLKNARVFWALPPGPAPQEALVEGQPAEPSPARKAEAEAALKHAEKRLKHRIAEELDLRYVPKLNFIYDQSSAVGSRIDYLLKKAGF